MLGRWTSEWYEIMEMPGLEFITLASQIQRGVWRTRDCIEHTCFIWILPVVRCTGLCCLPRVLSILALQGKSPSTIHLGIAADSSIPLLPIETANCEPSISPTQGFTAFVPIYSNSSAVSLHDKVKVWLRLSMSLSSGCRNFEHEKSRSQ